MALRPTTRFLVDLLVAFGKVQSSKRKGHQVGQSWVQVTDEERTLNAKYGKAWPAVRNVGKIRNLGQASWRRDQYGGQGMLC